MMLRSMWPIGWQVDLRTIAHDLNSRGGGVVLRLMEATFPTRKG